MKVLLLEHVCTTNKVLYHVYSSRWSNHLTALPLTCNPLSPTSWSRCIHEQNAATETNDVRSDLVTNINNIFVIAYISIQLDDRLWHNFDNLPAQRVIHVFQVLVACYPKLFVCECQKCTHSSSGWVREFESAHNNKSSFQRKKHYLICVESPTPQWRFYQVVQWILFSSISSSRKCTYWNRWSSSLGLLRL